jgi:hypothetical protein
MGVLIMPTRRNKPNSPPGAAPDRPILADLNAARVAVPDPKRKFGALQSGRLTNA